MVDGDQDVEFEYREKMRKLFNTEVPFKLKAVDASTKMIKVGEDGATQKLISCISDYFEVDQIILLEDLGLLTGLE